MGDQVRPPYVLGQAMWIENDTDRLLDQDEYDKPKYRDIGAQFLRRIDKNDPDDFDGCTVALVWCSAQPEATEDTAAFLVRAANSHDDLVAALRACAHMLDEIRAGNVFNDSAVYMRVDDAHAAIRRAEAKS